MIIDFRVRPPYKSFLKMGNLYGPNGSVHSFPVNGAGTKPVPSADEESMDLFMKEMDEAGITKGCLLSRRATTSWTGVDMKEIKELVDAYPGRFIGFGAVDISDDIMLSVSLVEEGKKLGFKGMVCEPGNSTYPGYADDRRLYPFYARCVELGMIVVVSMSQFLGSDISYSEPYRIQRVCRDFPKGNFVVAHAGYPHVTEAIGACVATPNLYLIPDLYWTVNQVPGRNLWTEAAVYLQGQRLLFGTAYPFRGLIQSVEDMKNVGLPEKFYNMVMYENAKELLGL